MKKIILLACFALTINACKKDNPVEAPAKVIGDTYQSGIIFYVDGTGQHGLIAAPADISSDNDPNTGDMWGCEGTSIPEALATDMGTGQTNTTAILAKCNTVGTAARLCDELVIGEYKDWFLPSRAELNFMHENLFEKKLGNLTEGYYWSSSQKDDDSAWTQFFGLNDPLIQQFSQHKNNSTFHTGNDDSKDTQVSINVRAVRVF
jgi:hypothetical protein